MQILCEIFTIHFGISKDTRKDGRSAVWQVETISLVELGKSIKVVIHKIYKQKVTRESFGLKYIL